MFLTSLPCMMHNLRSMAVHLLCTAPLNISLVVLRGQNICAPESISIVKYLAIKPWIKNIYLQILSTPASQIDWCFPWSFLSWNLQIPLHKAAGLRQRDMYMLFCMNYRCNWKENSIWRVLPLENGCFKPNFWLVGLSEGKCWSSFKMRPCLTGLWLLNYLVIM